jgi:hypothetical protein
MKGRERDPLSMASVVLRAVSPGQPTSVTEVLARVRVDYPAQIQKHVTVALVMLTNRGDVERVGRGQYRRIVKA